MSVIFSRVKVEEPQRMQRVIDWSRREKFKRAVHFSAGYLSVSGLGFLFACLMLGAVEYMLPLAVFMVICAVASVLSKPSSIALNLVNWRD